MNPNCVNILNKTVNNVCKLENQVLTNTQNIEFIMKYINFNKSLLLSLHGTNNKIPVTVQHYLINPLFTSDNLLKEFILGVLEDFNKNDSENYYYLIESSRDVPFLIKNVSFPSIIQISLVDSDKSGLISFLDSIKAGNINKLSTVVETLTSKISEPNSFVLAILHYLDKSPDISFHKETKVSLIGNNISSTYDELSRLKDEQHSKIASLSSRSFPVKNILDTVNIYLSKGKDSMVANYKAKSHNDPFYAPPTTADFIHAAKKIFLEDSSLESNGYLNYNAEPFQPYDPYEPSEPSDFNVNFLPKIDGMTSISENSEKIEFKIKQLLDLTETETTAE